MIAVEKKEHIMECKIKDLSIHYEIIGEGKPIVMIHGYSVDHRIMTGCMEPIFQMKNNYKRIYFDLPGMGKSGSADWITDSDKMLDIVMELIEKIIPNENFLLAGQSYGGYLARGIVNKMAERVDGLVLIGPMILPDFDKRMLPEFVVLQRDSQLLSQLTSEQAEDFGENIVVQSARNFKKYKSEVLSGIEIANSCFLQTLRKNGYSFSFTVDDLNEKFAKPALILTGRQDGDVGYRDAFDILENYPRATFAILDGTGHNLQIEQEGVFQSLMNEWLVRVSKLSVS